MNDTIARGLANVFCKGPDSKYVKLYMPHGLSRLLESAIVAGRNEEYADVVVSVFQETAHAKTGGGQWLTNSCFIQML